MNSSLINLISIFLSLGYLFSMFVLFGQVKDLDWYFYMEYSRLETIILTTISNCIFCLLIAYSYFYHKAKHYSKKRNS